MFSRVRELGYEFVVYRCSELSYFSHLTGESVNITVSIRFTKRTRGVGPENYPHYPNHRVAGIKLNGKSYISICSVTIEFYIRIGFLFYVYCLI